METACLIEKERNKFFGYDIDPTKHSRRSDAAFESTNKCLKKHLLVVDNCPSCGEERQIQYRASKKNKSCYKCFHNLPEMIEAKRNQIKTKSEETKQKMRDNHWSTRGLTSPFKDKKHSNDTKMHLANIAKNQFKNMSNDEYETHRIKSSLQGNRTLENFQGFLSPISVLIRQSIEGKTWTYDVLAKANFTCQKCQTKGGSLHAHHIDGFNMFPDKRFNVDNGACLCANCHTEFHDKYGRGDNTQHQYDDWLNAQIICLPQEALKV